MTKDSVLHFCYKLNIYLVKMSMMIILYNFWNQTGVTDILSNMI